MEWIDPYKQMQEETDPEYFKSMLKFTQMGIDNVKGRIKEIKTSEIARKIEFIGANCHDLEVDEYMEKQLAEAEKLHNFCIKRYNDVKNSQDSI